MDEIIKWKNLSRPDYDINKNIRYIRLGISHDTSEFVVVFKSVELVNHLIAKTKTPTRLRIVSNILNKMLETGHKVANNFKKSMRIKFDKYSPQWNYTAILTQSKDSELIKS